MKRLFPFIPIVFLLLFNSCDTAVQVNAHAVMTAIRQTQIFETRVAAPTSTPNPNIPTLINWLNSDLSTVSPLGRTMDALYHVVNISFPDASSTQTLIFRVDVGCICMNGHECCIPERTFVSILEAMKRNATTTLVQVPPGVSEMMVVCSNHQTKGQIGAITASWQDVEAYLRGNASGDQLGVRVTRTVAP